jgi:hypothetical protein
VAGCLQVSEVGCHDAEHQRKPDTHWKRNGHSSNVDRPDEEDVGEVKDYATNESRNQPPRVGLCEIHKEPAPVGASAT